MNGKPAGLSATELAAAVAELCALTVGAEVLDAAPLRDMPQDGDDLLLILRPCGAGETAPHKRFVHVALGSRRARVGTTSRRFGRDRQATGPRTDAIQKALVGRTLTAIEHQAGERRCTFGFGQLRLEVELFSAQGLWALCDADGTVRELSRRVVTKVRNLGPGDRYVPPPQRERAGGSDEPAPRFVEPVLEAIDAHFTAQDLADEAEGERRQWQVAAERAHRRQQHKIDGLQRQLAAAADAPRLRAEADLMLAYAHAVRRGAVSMTVPDPDGADDAQRTIALDPSKPVHAQANDRYERARRLTDGRAITEQRLAAAMAQADALAQALARLADERELTADERADLATQLRAAGASVPRAVPAREPGAGSRTGKGKPKGRSDGRLAGLNLRQFTSTEGYEILVGRDNQQNDKLSMRVAKGNDVWLHVGGGRAGSHVVIRLPRNKTASLETLLDAGTLAVHFSKARGERTIDVIYTFAKFVRKPKGSPAGAVVPQHTKTITVRLDEARLRRLLATAPADDAD